MIPYGKQDINKADIDAVIEVLKSDFLTQGPKVPDFEKNLVEYTGSNHAVAVNSATSALHIACLALGVGQGDIVWTSPITFVASSNCALYCGAEVDFVDIDFASNNMCATALQKKLEGARKEKRLPSVVIPVHMGGRSCEMEAIHKLSKEYGFKIIEDASHAIGGSYRSNKIGLCEFSDITVFSFHPVKVITTAEGGAALTNDKELYDKLILLRSHGVTREPGQMSGSSEGGWYYQQVELGFNYRMTDIQAALGCSQIIRLDEFVSKRNEIAKTYNSGLSNLPLDLPKDSDNIYSSYHLYIVKLSESSKINRLQLYTFLRDHGIGVNVHYIPVHLHPYYRDLGFSYNNFPRAEEYYSKAISLPLYPNLKPVDQDYIIQTISKAFA